ncbi:MAG: hypothetical protein SFV19_20760 [Rhodospirillaceae bacterium]|nr:hypothetical protein [Rhodospirillaceae bacterium]
MSKMGVREHRLHASATQRDLAFFRERERERALAAEKTAGLRALRLAKEEAERAAAQAAAEQALLNKPKRRTKKASAAPAPETATAE